MLNNSNFEMRPVMDLQKPSKQIAISTEKPYRIAIWMLTAISSFLLLWIFLLYTSYRSPILFGRYSPKYFIAATASVTIYSIAIGLLLRTEYLQKTLIIQKMLLLFQSTLTFLLIAEIIFRAMNGFGFTRGSQSVAFKLFRVTPYGRFTYCGQPSEKNEFCIQHRNNALGFNDKEYALRKAPGTYRILVLGDSYVEALQVPIQKTFHKILESDMNKSGWKSDVIAMGRMGAGTLFELNTLQEFGLAFTPDLVIVEFVSNDLGNNFPSLVKPPASFVPTFSKKVCFGHFDLPYFALDLIDHIFWRRMNHFGVYDTTLYRTDADWKKAWNVTFDSLTRIKQLCEQNHADLLVVGFTSRLEIASYEGPLALRSLIEERTDPGMVTKNHDFQLPDRVISEFCRRMKIQYLLLNPIFAEKRRLSGSKIDFHYYHDGHWNEIGHQAAAEAILTYLQSISPKMRSHS